MSDNLVFLALHFTISKLYANSFLATYAPCLLSSGISTERLVRRLNARDGIRDRHAGTPQEVPPSPFIGPNPFRRYSRKLTPVRPLTKHAPKIC